METDTCIWSYLAHFFLKWEMSQTKVVEKIKIHILYSVTFFRKSCRLWDNLEKIYYSRTGHRWQYGTWEFHAWHYKRTLRICNTYCSSTATRVAQIRLNVTFIRALPVLFSVYFPVLSKFLTIRETFEILFLPHVSDRKVIQEHILWTFNLSFYKFPKEYLGT